MGNKLNITEGTYTGVEKQLNILTDDGLDGLLKKLTDISVDRLNSGLVEYEGLQNIVKLFDLLTIERDNSIGNRLTIDDWKVVNEVVFNNESNQSAINYWLYRGMLSDLAEVIDEGYRYGLGGNSDIDTRLIKQLLYFFNTVYVEVK